VLLRFADPDERYAAVRLCSDLPLPDARRVRGEVRPAAAGLREPRWLEGDGVPGACAALSVRGRGLGAEVDIRIWSPADADADEPLPLLIAHDGPE
jgi:hypothetical protein